MKIVAPIRHENEIDALIAQGADELYCGIMPKEWAQRFGYESPLNRRETATGNIKSYRSLKEIIKGANRKGVCVHVTMNAHYYTQEHHKSLISILEHLAKIKVDALIVADVGLLLLIKKMKLPLKIVISGEAMVTNREAVDLFRYLGASRIILPRQVTLSEIHRITQDPENMEFESFIFSDDCFFDGGICNTVHHFSKDIFCREFLEKGSFWGLLKNIDDLIDADLTLSYFSWMKGTMCGICSICSLKKSGIHFLKIAGRTALLEDRLFDISIVKKALEIAQSGIADEEMIRRMIKIRGKMIKAMNPQFQKTQHELCMLGNSCYYPDDALLIKARSENFKKGRYLSSYVLPKK